MHYREHWETSQAGPCRLELLKDAVKIKTLKLNSIFTVNGYIFFLINAVFAPWGKFRICGTKANVTREDAALRLKRKKQHWAKNRKPHDEQ